MKTINYNNIYLLIDIISFGKLNTRELNVKLFLK